ncbi:thiamine-phosphate kinase [Legionella lytica]|uniref:Thiamine-monophosphate kinase n=1 Tax=Legionella lytica TaxID=96232 RepID=A0ABW8D476_9GAMM
MDEFSLIDRFFKPLDLKRNDVLLGIGDDAACLQVPNGMNLLVSTDTLVAKVHFLPDWDAYNIAYRSVMVSVSDLAAMAAQPCWALLALTLPQMEPSWLESFAHGLSDSLRQFNIALIGGDTTRGPLSITLTVFGQAPLNQEVRRRGAQPGDIIFVSGNIGAAALAVKFLDKQNISSSDHATLMHKLLHPQPRIDLINFLRLYATAAIDISDGLSADLNHICTASEVGACLNLDAIPIEPLVKHYYPDKAVDLALTGGDDYELCFTVPELKVDSLMHELEQAGMVCYPIGVIEQEPGLRVKTAENLYHEIAPKGYSHF